MRRRGNQTGISAGFREIESSVGKQFLGEIVHRTIAFQKHLRCTIDGPLSSYSCFVIHICWNVDSDARIEPPIHTLYLRSGGEMILMRIELQHFLPFTVRQQKHSYLGANEAISFCIRSAMPGNIDVPPLRTVFAYRSLRMSTSHFMMLLYAVS